MLRWLKRKQEEPKPEAETLAQETKTEPQLPLEFVAEKPTEGVWLETEDKEGRNLFLPLTRKSVLLGTSDECDVKLGENLVGQEKVKDKHARIEKWRERWVIVPLDKNSPIFVNSKRTGENTLRNGWEFQLGEDGVKFVFRQSKQQE